MSDGAPHVGTLRPEQVPHRPRAGQHGHRRDRDEPIEMARRGGYSRRRTPASQEARCRRGGTAEALASLAQRSERRRARNQTHRRRLRGRARRLRTRGVEAHVIHPTSVAVSREHRRAKTDRLDTELLKRAFLGWLRGERGHCTMAAIPTVEEEDAKRPNREHESLVGERTRIVNRMKSTLARLGVRGFKSTLRKASERLETLRTPEGTPLPPNTLAELGRDMARLRFVMDQIGEVEAARLERLARRPEEGAHAMIRLLARIVGVGIETADMLVREVLSRDLRDRRAVARYAGLTGSPDESGASRREQGLAKAGNARVRRGMIQLAWRFPLRQKDSALARWYRARTADARAGTRKTLIVALARKLLVGLWQLVTTGKVPEG